jgi:hypothetical protein
MNKETSTLLSIYRGFLSERSEYLDGRWKKISSYFKRTFGRDNEYSCLLSTEGEFRDKLYEWITGHINVNMLTAENIGDARVSMKLFKEELSSRNFFLVLFVAILAISTGFYNLLDEIFGTKRDVILLMTNSAFALLAVFERGNNAKHISYCTQLDLLLEKWLKENDKS